MNIATLVGGIAVVGWIVFIAIVALLFSGLANKSLSGATSMVLGSLIVAVVLSAVSAGLVFINPQERGVVISAFSPQGYREQALQPGLRWIIPFAESVIRYPVSSRPTRCPSHRLKVRTRVTID